MNKIITLSKIIIKGFKSIEKMEIDLKPGQPLILVGKNESGKSNILKAFSLLSEKEKFTLDDKKRMSHLDEYCIRYEYIFNEEVLKTEMASILEDIFSDSSIPVFKEEDNLEYFIRKFSTNLFYENEVNEGFALVEPYLIKDEINEGWYEVINSNFCNDKSLKKYVHISEIEEDLIKQGLGINDILNYEYIKETNIDDIFLNIFNFNTLSDLYIPKVIFWSYNEGSHNLPTSVNKDNFKNNPSYCLPLKNMFNLAGFNDAQITKEFDECNNSHQDSENMYKSLFDTVSKEVNTYIKNSWKNYEKEYENVRIVLSDRGNDLTISIQDKENSFGFDLRSDGFKRFISFLLLQAVVLEKDKENKTQTIIIIDEPESGLHPSSARDLRDKLLELAKDNLVVYSTHSISMIDSDNIENNIIVTKDGENTTIEIAKEDGVSPAENVYQSLGYSIFDELKKFNIIVEGQSDKRIIKKIIKDDKDIGICFAKGVHSIRYIVSILELASRKYIILSDCDKGGKDGKNAFEEKEKWFTYKDLGFEHITIEDFLKDNFIKQEIKKIEELKKIISNDFTLPKFNKITHIENKFKENFNNDWNKIKKQLKDNLCNNCKEKHIQKTEIQKLFGEAKKKLKEINTN